LSTEISWKVIFAVFHQQNIQTHRLHISIQQPTLSLTDSLSFPLKIKDGADVNKVHNDTQAKR